MPATLRSTAKRLKLIHEVEKLCRELNIPVEIELATIHYGELVILRVFLELKKIEEK